MTTTTRRPAHGTAPPDRTDVHAELETLRARLQRREDRAAVRASVRAQREHRRADDQRSRVRRRAEIAGARARTRHEVTQTGEARAMRVEATRSLALAVLLPVLAAFGGWSSAGVQAGMVRLLSLPADSAQAAAAWLVEPALLGIVAGCVLIRARLQSLGGDLDPRAGRIVAGALVTSIALNAIGHWPTGLTLAAVGGLFGHSIGPVGAAVTAHLIGLVQDSIATARPWRLPDGSRAPSLADLTTPDPPPAPAPAAGAAAGVPAWPGRAPAGAVLLPIVARPAAPGSAAAPRSESTGAPASESTGAPASESTVRRSRTRPARRRTNTQAPASGAGARALSDTDLAARLDALVRSGDIAADASVRQVQAALGTGFDRAKRVMAVREERTEREAPAPALAALDSAAESAPDGAAEDGEVRAA